MEGFALQYLEKKMENMEIQKIARKKKKTPFNSSIYPVLVVVRKNATSGVPVSHGVHPSMAKHDMNSGNSDVRGDCHTVSCTPKKGFDPISRWENMKKYLLWELQYRTKRACIPVPVLQQ